MDDFYSFKPEDTPRITLLLGVQALAHQIAFSTIMLERLEISDHEKDEVFKQMTSLVAEKKEELLRSMYASFGKTPDL